MAAYIRTQLEAAKSAKQQLIVYVGATWCEPCRRFHDAFDAGLLNADFPTIRFVEFDADIHEQVILKAGYASKYIPLFSIPNAEGLPQGKHIMGAIKGKGAVPYITPKLKALLAQDS